MGENCWFASTRTWVQILSIHIISWVWLYVCVTLALVDRNRKILKSLPAGQPT